MTPQALAQIVDCSPLDYTVVGIYFVAVLGFGLYFGRYSRSTRDFFFGGQRFSAWLLAVSILASVIGTYSFIKYSDVGFRYGLSSSMTYLNDWFYIPVLMFVWLPVIYYSRVRSVPEYLEKRFDRRARVMAAALLIVYMLGYVGYTIFTLGKVTNHLFGVNLYVACAVVAAVTAIYITVGGQTAIIFTDLAQAVMLIVGGLTLIVLGLLYLGDGNGLWAGIASFWENTPFKSRLPFADFNQPADFNFVGVFWQDMANSCVYFFVNQGLIMRFLAAKSVDESRKTILILAFCLLPVAVVIVGGAGWIGHAIAHKSPATLDPNTPGDQAFITVARVLCQPGVFGFIIAALIAALMSTADTMINAIAAIWVVDIYEPHLAPRRRDRHYLKVARVTSVIAAAIGLALVVVFTQYRSIYEAHAVFTATVTPLLGVPVLMGVVWKRFTPAAAFGAMLIGAIAAVVSFQWPQVLRPFMDLHGIPSNASGSYMRALFLLVVAVLSGTVITWVTRPKQESDLTGLWIGSIEAGRRIFKNGPPNDRPSQPVVTKWVAVDHPMERVAEPPSGYPFASLSRHQMAQLNADPGDLIYIADARRYLGGLRSLHAVAAIPHEADDAVHLHPATAASARLVPERPVRVEKII